MQHLTDAKCCLAKPGAPVVAPRKTVGPTLSFILRFQGSGSRFMDMDKKIKHRAPLSVSGIICALGVCLLSYSCAVQKDINYSIISVPEEGGINFVRITDDADKVTNPVPASGTFSISGISGTTNIITWWVNPVIGLSPDGSKVAYLNYKENMSNIMEKSATTGGPSTQRTFRSRVTDFSWSPDGQKFCFSEFRNNVSNIYMVNAGQGSVVRQISTTSANDYSPTMSHDGNTVYFHRREGTDIYSLWSFDIEKNLFSNYSRGMTPCVVPQNTNIIYCARFTTNKESEIWKLNLETGTEEILLSKPGRSFTTPKISPNGQWILCTGSSITAKNRQNTDIYVIRTDGTMFTQLTYHPGNDLSAIWSPDGKSVFFVSQRGTNKDNTYNVWKMDFNL